MSLTQQQANSKSLTGLSDDFATNIITNTLEVIDELTLDTGGILTLPANSIQDSYLSSNVALLNRTPQTFTGANTFNADTTQGLGTIYFFNAPSNGTRTRLSQANTGFTISNNNLTQFIALQTRTASNVAIIGVQCSNGNTAFLQGDLNNRITITASSTPTISTQAPALSNDFSIANTAWIVAKAYAQLGADQTFTGINTFNALTVHNATLRNFQSTQAVFPGDFRMLDSTQTYLTQMYQSGTTCVIDSAYASSKIQMTTRNASNVGLNNIVIENNNHVVLQGSASEIDILGNVVTINGVTNHTANTTFNANVNLKYPALLNVLDTSLTRGLQIQNDNTNPGLTLFRGVGNSSRFNFLSNNASGVASTNFYIFNGDTCYLQGASGLGIGMSGSAISLDGVCSFTNTTTPVITQALSLLDNSTKIATTAYVQGQGYALASDLSNYGLLASSNTWTGTTNTFSNASLGNQIAIRSTANAGSSTISQVSNALVISAVTNNPSAFSSTITLSTRSSVNGGVVILTGNATSITIGGNTTTTNISSTNLVVNGFTQFTSTTTPVITQTIATADDSTKIPTTAWVRLQNYLVASALTPYALLTPSANPQIFTGQQQFKSTLANLPVSITSSTGGITGAGGLYVATANGQYNSIVKTNDLVLLGSGTGLDSASTKLTLTTYASSPVGIQIDIGNMTFDGGIIRQNSPFNCGYSYIGTPVTIKGFYDIGYVWNIPYASFTGGAFGTSVVIYNILTLAWDGSGNKRLGVWRVDVVIMITNTGAPLTQLSWNTTNATTMPLTDTCVVVSDAGVFGATGVQIARMSFTINVVNLTTTYYLNSYVIGGSGLASNTTSQITFTRIA